VKKLILAIESSCDETAAALVDAHGSVIGSELVSQISTHNLYGGVVPEVASRAHFEEIDAVVRTLVQKSGIDPLRDLEAVAATMGPGLIGPLLVGVSYARGIAVAWKKPFVGVHHLRGHLASALLEKDPTRSMRDQLRELSPALVLLASGGHTQLLLLEETFSATSLADTADDAAGECFDKSAKLMGLPYPGGPAIEKLARESSGGERAKAFASELPKPKSAAGFSFSGLKTAIRLKLSQNPALQRDADFCWAIEDTIAQVFERALKATYGDLKHEGRAPRTLVLCGGVSANLKLRSLFERFAEGRKMQVLLPPLRYCTDNAAMIAGAAWLQSDEQNLVDVQARIPMEISRGASR